ncbi:GNAT family N-acetyltransferase [Nonomuraea sp. NPDC050153]|uniref:GNAT family N-acetyltransferase n=1 Tax=Nonomuraea sp. NPDC050153 TaxID=3364359 RepID=UPI00378F2E51
MAAHLDRLQGLPPARHVAKLRRRGLARRLVGQLIEFAGADGGYQAVYLHTYPHSPGALALWDSLATRVCDERREVPGGGSGVVHFEAPPR